MSTAQLLAIVEVPRGDRIRCQSEGCNHSVYRRIHVVRENSTVRVYGSECFKKLFDGFAVASAKPKFTSSEGRQLTDEERRLLIENTERLVQQFESEYESELARKAASIAPSPPPTRELPPPPQVFPPISAADQLAAEAQAKQLVRSQYSVNPDLPGWRGLVLAEMTRILSGKTG